MCVAHTTITPSKQLPWIHMLVYHNCASFRVLSSTIHLYSEKMHYGLNTVAEVDDKIHYLGNELPNITTAVFAWEDLNGRSMTKEELRQVMIDNEILQQGK